MRELARGPWRKRVGRRPWGRAPVRGGAEILGPDASLLGMDERGDGFFHLVIDLRELGERGWAGTLNLVMAARECDADPAPVEA